MDESDLIARVLAGERDAFRELLERHTAPLLASLRSILVSRDDADEVLQETWLRAYRELGRLRDGTRLRAWLVSIALNLARARHRRRGASPVLDGDPAPSEHEPAPVDDPVERMARAEELLALERRVAELPARQREVVDLRVNHELSHAEIAGLLGISEEASRANYYQGMKRLKESLAPRDAREGRRR